MVYIMKVDDCMSFADYYDKYPKKRPKRAKKHWDDHNRSTCGDNIYKPNSHKKHGFEQLPSFHSNIKYDKDGNVVRISENQETKKHDLNGKYVLISRNFVYFGCESIGLKPYLKKQLIVTRGHKCNFPDKVIKKLRNKLLTTIAKIFRIALSWLTLHYGSQSLLLIIAEPNPKN